MKNFFLSENIVFINLNFQNFMNFPFVPKCPSKTKVAKSFLAHKFYTLLNFLILLFSTQKFKFIKFREI